MPKKFSHRLRKSSPRRSPQQQHRLRKSSPRRSPRQQHRLKTNVSFYKHVINTPSIFNLFGNYNKQTSTCSDVTDPITFEDFKEGEIIIKLVSNKTTNCFSLETLSSWLKKNNTNPLTREIIPKDIIKKIIDYRRSVNKLNEVIKEVKNNPSSFNNRSVEIIQSIFINNEGKDEGKDISFITEDIANEIIDTDNERFIEFVLYKMLVFELLRQENTTYESFNNSFKAFKLLLRYLSPLFSEDASDLYVNSGFLDEENNKFYNKQQIDRRTEVINYLLSNGFPILSPDTKHNLTEDLVRFNKTEELNLCLKNGITTPEEIKKIKDSFAYEMYYQNN